MYEDINKCDESEGVREHRDKQRSQERQRKDSIYLILTSDDILSCLASARRRSHLPCGGVCVCVGMCVSRLNTHI